jgi:putative ABC transport system permease protein
MSTAYKKIWRDLWRNKGRTMMVVVSIAVGVMAVGMVMSANSLVLGQMSASHQASNPSHGVLFLNGVIDESTVHSLENVPGVDQIEGFAEIGIRWKNDLTAEWQDGRIISVEDFENQKFDQITLKDGDWPISKLIGVEQVHIDSFGAPGIGGTIFIEVNERARPFTINGTTRNPFEWPLPFGQNAVFYAAPTVLEEFGGFRGSTRLRLTVDDYSQANVQAVVDAIDDKLQKIGVSVGFYEVLHPEDHYLQEMINGVGLVLTVMAVGSLGLSALLVINTINALIAQQTTQIGIMKAIGGQQRQIMLLYLSGVFIYGLLALLIAVPLGALGGSALSQWMLYLLNVPARPYEILPHVLLIQIGIGLLTPLLAGLVPIIQGVSIPAARAISQTGIGSGRYGTHLLDRLVSKIRSIPRMAALSLRNTFRRPGRVVLTMLTLTIAGAFFIMIFSTQNSFIKTLDKIFAGFGYEIQVVFDQQQRIDEVIPLIESRPNVANAEMWVFRTAETRLPGASGPGTNYEVFMRGVPAQSPLFNPELTAGRMLLPEDQRALLLNQKLAGKMGVAVGDQVIVDLPNIGETYWTVVGLVFDLNGRDQNTAFANIDTLNRALHNVGRGAVVMVQATQHDLATQQSVEKDLRDYFEAQGMQIGYTALAIEDRQQASAQFGVLVQVLMVMTILMAVVGSIGLSGTLSINVIERRREIGVMRAVGASSRDVGFVFTGEGLMLGITSWLLAVPLGIAASPTFVKILGDVIDFPAVYYPGTDGVLLWLGIVIILSIFASWLPARRATRISVRESLAYE